jgi:hypothetical protein
VNNGTFRPLDPKWADVFERKRYTGLFYGLEEAFKKRGRTMAIRMAEWESTENALVSISESIVDGMGWSFESVNLNSGSRRMGSQ